MWVLSMNLRESEYTMLTYDMRLNTYDFYYRKLSYTFYAVNQIFRFETFVDVEFESAFMTPLF